MRRGTFKLILPAAMGLTLAAAAFAAEVPRAVGAGAGAGAAGGATTRPVQQLQKWFDDLAASEAEVRERARFELMGMSRDDLPAFREVVRKQTPLAPAQAAVLQDVVVQVYLAEDEYDAHLRTGFLGVMLARVRPGGLMAPEDATVQLGDSGAGVLITAAIPGFCGFRHLQAGDVVLGVEAPEFIRTPSGFELIQAISQTPPGQRVTLHLLRQGRFIQVPLEVSSRPLAAADEIQMQQFTNERQARAEQYWREHFAPLVEGRMS